MNAHSSSPSSLFIKIFLNLLAFLALSAGVYANAQPVSSNGYQSIGLYTTSTDSQYNNKSITSMDYDLRIIQMGNAGISTAFFEFGWNEKTSELALLHYIPDGKHLNSAELQYEWVPLSFATEGQIDSTTGQPTGGMGAPFFPGFNRFQGIPSRNDGIIGPAVKGNLIASADGEIGKAGADGAFVSKWYACDGASWGSALSWSFGDAAPADFCVPLELHMVNNPKPISGAGSTSGPSGTVPTTVSQLYQPSQARSAGPVMQTINAASRADTGSVLGLMAGGAMAVLTL